MQLLKNKTNEQDAQLQDVNMKAAELIQRQSQLQQGLIEQQQQFANNAPQLPPEMVVQALAAIRSDINGLDPNETGERIRSWIEQ